MGTGRTSIGLLLAILTAAAAAQLASAPADAAQAASAGACQQAPTPGDSEITLTSGGVQRSASVHVPPAATGQRLPVLFGLHGAGGKFFESYSGFSILADSEEFIAVYPNPIDELDGHTSWDIASTRPGGDPDVNFISDLLDYVESNLCVDSSRVYAAGVSNGGGMAARLACELSSRFAAIASIAGGYKSLPPCLPANPVSVVEVHGTNDQVVPYDGSPPDGAGAVQPWLAGWRYHDGCVGRPAVSRIAPRAERYDWTDCNEGAAVEHIEIFGGNHQLPGGLPPDQGQTGTVSATWLAWLFLRQHQQVPPGPPPASQGGVGVARARAARHTRRSQVTVHADPALTAAKPRLSLTMAASPNPVVFGAPLEVEGRLSGANFSNHERRYEVVLQANPFPYRAGFRPVGQPELTDGQGSFSFAFSGLLDNAALRIATAGQPEVFSPTVLESIAVRVSFHAAATVRRGFVRLYGTVAPAQSGAKVGFELIGPGGTSVNEGGAAVGAAVGAGASAVSSFSRVLRVPRGVYRALVKVSNKAYVSNYSAPIQVP